MRKQLLWSILVVLIFTSPSLSAETKYALGNGNVALKVDYFRFTEDVFEDVDLEDGVYVGLEGYASFFLPNLYFGLESGWAGTESDGDVLVFGEREHIEVEADYVPIEFNAKYVFELSPCFTLDLGAGISYNYFSIDLEADGFSGDADDWVLGGQIFADFNYKVCDWFFGVNAKYQFTDDLEFSEDRHDLDTDVSADNLRVGAQVGYMF